MYITVRRVNSVDTNRGMTL